MRPLHHPQRPRHRQTLHRPQNRPPRRQARQILPRPIKPKPKQTPTLQIFPQRPPNQEAFFVPSTKQLKKTKNIQHPNSTPQFLFQKNLCVPPRSQRLCGERHNLKHSIQNPPPLNPPSPITPFLLIQLHPILPIPRLNFLIPLRPPLRRHLPLLLSILQLRNFNLQIQKTLIPRHI